MKGSYGQGNLVRGYLAEQDRLKRRAGLKFLALAILLLAAWWAPAHLGLDAREQEIWDKVRAAQGYIAAWRQGQGFGSDPKADPWRLGLIGLEISPLTTTAGSLEAKRTACNPAWSIITRRWLQGLGLKRGDRVAMYSSASFPGMILNVLTSAEQLGLDVLLVVSLGSSIWGANHPQCPWPVLAARLRSQGCIRTRAAFYTLGGGQENGGGLSPEGRTILRQAAVDAGVRLIHTANLQEMIDRKWRLLKEHGAKVLVNIGGSQANLGTDQDVLTLKPGLLQPGQGIRAGNGVLGLALQNGMPVVHFLNLKALCTQTGVPFDSPPSKRFLGKWSLLIYGLALAVFALVLFTHSRWGFWQPPEADTQAESVL
ncbi:MAG: poly-gamma-glutamate system protein [Desulfarculaceae bacterium]|jgi:poly-gamma-glutamate system protein